MHPGSVLKQIQHGGPACIHVLPAIKIVVDAEEAHHDQHQQCRNQHLLDTAYAGPTIVEVARMSAYAEVPKDLTALDAYNGVY